MAVSERSNQWGVFIAISVQIKDQSNYIIVPGGIDGLLWADFASWMRTGFVPSQPHRIGNMNYRKALIGGGINRSESPSGPVLQDTSHLASKISELRKEVSELIGVVKRLESQLLLGATPPYPILSVREDTALHGVADVSSEDTDLVSESKSRVSETQLALNVDSDPLEEHRPVLDEALSRPVQGLRSVDGNGPVGGTGFAGVGSSLEENRIGLQCYKPALDGLVLDGLVLDQPVQVGPVSEGPDCGGLEQVGQELFGSGPLAENQIFDPETNRLFDVDTVGTVQAGWRANTGKSKTQKRPSYIAVWRRAFLKIKNKEERESYEQWKAIKGLVRHPPKILERDISCTAEVETTEVVGTAMETETVQVYLTQVPGLLITDTQSGIGVVTGDKEVVPSRDLRTNSGHINYGGSGYGNSGKYKPGYGLY